MNKKAKSFLSVLVLASLTGSIASCKGQVVVSDSSSENQISSSASSSGQASSSKEDSSASSVKASSEDSSEASSQASSSAASSSAASSEASSETSSESSSEISSEVSSEASSASSEESSISVPVTYTITWSNSDGTVLDTDTVEKGVTPKYTGETPTKTADAQYTYTFDGWTPEVIAAVSNATYTAHYATAINSYKITWENYDGSVLEEDTSAFGATPTYDSATPTKAATEQYTYTFTGWTPEVSSVKADITYTATFSEALTQYSITWLNADGKELEKDSVEWGATPEYKGDTPTKDPLDEETAYQFTGWDAEIAAVSKDATYTAVFEECQRLYTITYKDYDGTILQQEELPYMAYPYYKKDYPSSIKEDNAYTYEWQSWDKEILPVTEDATYTALYYGVAKEFTVTWVNPDGSILDKTQSEYGNSPYYSKTTPFCPATLDHSYTFKGWSPSFKAVTADVTYTAEYDEVPASYTSEGLTYTYSDGAYSVTGYTGDAYYLDIPSTYNDGTNGVANVTSLGASLFENNTVLAVCNIPDTVTAIGEKAFAGCSHLLKTNVPEGVTAIADHAFMGCEKLTDLSLPSSLTSIGWASFTDCVSLPSINIPASVTTIDNYAFSGCNSLAISVDSANTVYASEDNALFNKDMTQLIFLSPLTEGEYAIPDTVTDLAAESIYRCYKLTKVIFGTSVKTFSESTNDTSRVFDGCLALSAFEVKDGNTSLSAEDGILYNADKTILLRTPVTKEGDFTLINSVTTLSDYAFTHCTNLSSFTAGDNLTSINPYVFYDCENMKTFALPDTITYIGDGAFNNSGVYENATVENNVYYLLSADKTISYLLQGRYAKGDVTLRSDTKVILGNAFYMNSYMTSLVIPDSVVYIGYYAIAGCSVMTSLTLSKNITSLEYYTFTNDTALTSLVIPEGVTSINNWAFYGDSGLTLYFAAADSSSISANAFGNVKADVKACCFYTETSNTDGAHWHYVNDVPTIWAA